jgi:seryl-tRNA synthetase
VNAPNKSLNASNRRSNLPAEAIQKISLLYEEHKSVQSDLNGKLHRRSQVSELVRTSVGVDKVAAIEEAKNLKSEISSLKQKLDAADNEMMRLSLLVPNDTHPSVPVGPEEAANLVSTHGLEPLPATEQRDHLRIATALDMVDFKAAATVTGSSWYYLTGAGALLENALTQYALQKVISRGYTPVFTPDLVRYDIATRCGFQPRDNSNPPVQQMYHIQHTNANHTQPELVLSGTAEIPLGGMFAMRDFAKKELPCKVVGLGRAFRCEAGARGADTRGLYRVHQFTKVELFAVTEQEDSESIMDEMLRLQVELFSGLGLPIR